MPASARRRRRRAARALLDLACVLVLALLPAFALAGGDRELVLRQDATSAGPEVRLADLFENVGEEAGAAVVAPAPAPGETALLYPSRVQKAVAEAGLTWTNPERRERIRVTGAFRAVSEAEIAAALEEELLAELAAEAVEITLDRRGAGWAVAPHLAGPVLVEELAADPRTQRFTARLALAGSSASLAVSGRAIALVEIPVLARPLGAGAILAAADLDLKRLRADRLPPGTLTRIEDLVGKALSRPSRAGQPLRASDVTPPLLVAKNAIVTMVFELPGMTLQDRGRALEAGAEGSSIKVMNLGSNRIVTGTIAADGRVFMGGMLTLASR